MSANAPLGAFHQPRNRRSKWIGALGIWLVLGLALSLQPPADPVGRPDPVDLAATTLSDVTVVQANINSRLSVADFREDVTKVLAVKPDFITYNEVPLRANEVLAPGVYDVHRDMTNRYTAATAVAWRTDRWTMVDSGTRQISNYRKRIPGKNVKLGWRFVNWVTVQSDDGREVSVISVHVAPPFRAEGREWDLSSSSVKKLGVLVGELAPRGPVLASGDFNFHYQGPRYAREELAAADLVPTFDVLGDWFVTSDHGAFAIDYSFNRGEGKLVAEQHRRFELNSDHDAVVAGYDWLGDAPEETTTYVNDPDGTIEERKRVLNVVAGAVRDAKSGSTIDVVSSDLGQLRLVRRLRWAIERGVHVQVVTRSANLTPREQSIARTAAAVGDPDSWVRQCDRACARGWYDLGGKPGFLLVSDAAGNPTQRIDVTRNLSTNMVQLVTKAVVREGENGLEAGELMLERMG